MVFIARYIIVLYGTLWCYITVLQIKSGHLFRSKCPAPVMLQNFLNMLLGLPMIKPIPLNNIFFQLMFHVMAGKKHHSPSFSARKPGAM